MHKIIIAVMLFVSILFFPSTVFAESIPRVQLGNDVLMDEYYEALTNKSIGLVTNHTGINSSGENFVNVLAEDENLNLAALYAPEHGIDGKALAGEYVESYAHEELGIPVYSLYGRTREPTADMLQEVDILLFDIQDIGARSYTYMSTLNYCMVAGEKYDTPVWILDRPNPLGGMRVEGPMMEDKFISFVGVDNLPKAHGMTAGELARFFNRKINADIKVIPMRGYQRNMIFQDTGLPWVQTSPRIPDIDSAFGYMATGLGSNTGVFQADDFKWIGGSGLHAESFVEELDSHNLGGIEFTTEIKNGVAGARLTITDYREFNPARTGIYALATAFTMEDFNVPMSGDDIVMFDKIMGTDEVGRHLLEGDSGEQIEKAYAPGIARFEEERQRFLLDEYAPEVLVSVNETLVQFDTKPFIDSNNRLLVPVRAIAEELNSDVKWDGKTQTVTITTEALKIRFSIGSNHVLVNDTYKTMDTAPVIKSNRTMVPVRFISEYLGHQVEWNGKWRFVEIN